MLGGSLPTYRALRVCKPILLGRLKHHVILIEEGQNLLERFLSGGITIFSRATFNVTPARLAYRLRA